MKDNQLNIFYELAKENFMDIKSNNIEIPSYNEVQEYFTKFTNWKFTKVERKVDYIRAEMYDFTKTIPCKILILTPEIAIDKCNRTKEDLEDDLYRMLRMYFGVEFMVKIVKNNINIIWEIPEELFH